MQLRLSCEQIETGTSGYLDDSLPLDLHRQFDLHLSRCPECRMQLARIRWTAERLAALPREPMPPAVKERLLSAVRRPLPGARDAPLRAPRTHPDRA